MYHGPGQKAWEHVPDAKIINPTDAIVQVDITTICGTDLHILKGDVPAVTSGRILGHEGVGTPPRQMATPLPALATSVLVEQQPAQYSGFGEGLARRWLPGPPPHSQGTQEKGTEEQDNADDQQVKQALGDDTHDAEHDRHDHEEEEEGKHLMLRSVVLVSAGPVDVHRWYLADRSGRSA